MLRFSKRYCSNKFSSPISTKLYRKHIIWEIRHFEDTLPQLHVHCHIIELCWFHLAKCQAERQGLWASCFIFSPEETPIPVEDPVVSEVSYVLREWVIIWRQKYLVSVTSISPVQ